MSDTIPTPRTEECEFGVLAGNKCRLKATIFTRSGYKCCIHHCPHERGILRKDAKLIEPSLCPKCGAESEKFSYARNSYQCISEPLRSYYTEKCYYTEEINKLKAELTASRGLCRQYKEVSEELADKCSNHTTACSWLDRVEGCDCEIKEIKAELEALNQISLSPETPINTGSTAH